MSCAWLLKRQVARDCSGFLSGGKRDGQGGASCSRGAYSEGAFDGTVAESIGNSNINSKININRNMITYR